MGLLVLLSCFCYVFGVPGTMSGESEPRSNYQMEDINKILIATVKDFNNQKLSETLNSITPVINSCILSQFRHQNITARTFDVISYKDTRNIIEFVAFFHAASICLYDIGLAERLMPNQALVKSFFLHHKLADYEALTIGSPLYQYEVCQPWVFEDICLEALPLNNYVVITKRLNNNQHFDIKCLTSSFPNEQKFVLENILMIQFKKPTHVTFYYHPYVVRKILTCAAENDI